MRHKGFFIGCIAILLLLASVPVCTASYWLMQPRLNAVGAAPAASLVTPTPSFQNKLEVIDYVQKYHLPASDRISIQERTYIPMTLVGLRWQSVGWTAEQKSEGWYVQWHFTRKNGEPGFAEWLLHYDGSVSNANVWAEQLTPLDSSSPYHNTF